MIDKGIEWLIGGQAFVMVTGQDQMILIVVDGQIVDEARGGDLRTIVFD